MNNRSNGSDYESLRLNREGQAEAFDAIGNRYDEAFPHKEGQVSAGEWLIRSLPAGSRVSVRGRCGCSPCAKGYRSNCSGRVRHSHQQLGTSRRKRVGDSDAGNNLTCKCAGCRAESQRDVEHVLS